jgi:hypothetical protein
MRFIVFNRAPASHAQSFLFIGGVERMDYTGEVTSVCAGAPEAVCVLRENVYHPTNEQSPADCFAAEVLNLCVEFNAEMSKMDAQAARVGLTLERIDLRKIRCVVFFSRRIVAVQWGNEEYGENRAEVKLSRAYFPIIAEFIELYGG